MRREPGRHLAVDLLHLRIGVRGIEIEEHRGDPLEQLAAALERHDRVLEVRRRDILRNGRNFLELRAHARFEGLAIIVGADPIERRQLEWQRTRAGERIVHDVRDPQSSSRF